MVVVSAWHVGGTRGSGIMSSTDDVVGISGVVAVTVIRILFFVLHVCMLGTGFGRVGLCYVCVSCESGFFV